MVMKTSESLVIEEIGLRLLLFAAVTTLEQPPCPTVPVRLRHRRPLPLLCRFEAQVLVGPYLAADLQPL